MMISRAITRRPNPALADGITTSNLGRPDYDRAIAQYEAYLDALRDCGVAVTELAPLDGCPDAHFVEDTAVVAREVAVITRPGATARRDEVDTVEAALRPFRETVRIRPPGTLDGGDVLMIGSHVFIGLSDRTTTEGASQLGRVLSDFGYTWETVPVAAGLHFKSSVNAVAGDTLLTTRAFADHPALSRYRLVPVAEPESYAGNTLLVNGRLIMPAGYPDTRRRLSRLGSPIIELDTSEFRKMDGGLTCLSLRF